MKMTVGRDQVCDLVDAVVTEAAVWQANHGTQPQAGVAPACGDGREAATRHLGSELKALGARTLMRNIDGVLEMAHMHGVMVGATEAALLSTVYQDALASVAPNRS